MLFLIHFLGTQLKGCFADPPLSLVPSTVFSNLRFLPQRKVISEAYELEYGQDCLEMHVGAIQPGEHALVIDDLVATGGTLSAAIKLLERVGAEVFECACVIGLPEVKGQCRLNGKPLYILVELWEIDNCYRGRPPLLLCYHIKLQ
ncbi:hypothetical protein UlMin_023487 [Ulmus minor]